LYTEADVETVVTTLKVKSTVTSSTNHRESSKEKIAEYMFKFVRANIWQAQRRKI
jgi:hypothetical protein